MRYLIEPRYIKGLFIYKVFEIYMYQILLYVCNTYKSVYTYYVYTLLYVYIYISVYKVCILGCLWVFCVCLRVFCVCVMGV